MADIKAKFVRKDFLLISILLLVSAGILWVDLLIPLGVAAGVPYFVVVLVAVYASWRHSILLFAVLGTALTVLGYIFPIPAALPGWSP